MTSRTEALAAQCLPLLWNNLVLPRLHLQQRGRTLANIAFATGYAQLFHGRPRWLSAEGIRWGLGAAAVIATGYTTALAIPPIRSRLQAMTHPEPETTPAEWIAIHIPFGTAYTEELIFRATLDPLLESAYGPRRSAALGALTFGLWHIYPARAAGDAVLPTIAATTAAGWGFGLLYRHTGSATAPASAHAALNAGGAVVARQSTDHI